MAAIADYAARFGDRFLVLDYHALSRAGEGRDRVAAFLGLQDGDDAERDLPHRNASYAPRSPALAAALRSPAIRRAARAILPATLRRRAWTTATEANKHVYRPDPAEIGALRDALRDEIAACIRNPLIPTGELAHGRLGRVGRWRPGRPSPDRVHGDEGRGQRRGCAVERRPVDDRDARARRQPPRPWRSGSCVRRGSGSVFVSVRIIAPSGLVRTRVRLPPASTFRAMPGTARRCSATMVRGVSPPSSPAR